MCGGKFARAVTVSNAHLPAAGSVGLYIRSHRAEFTGYAYYHPIPNFSIWEVTQAKPGNLPGDQVGVPRRARRRGTTGRRGPSWHHVLEKVAENREREVATAS